MVQSFDYGVNKPNYNAVKINIKKPEINAGNSRINYVDDNGIYNAVNVEIDNPTVNTEPKRIYDYPTSNEVLTSDMLNLNPIPVKFPVAYHTTNVILPKLENEMEVELEDKPEEVEEPKAEEKAPEVPAPNPTTVENEKGNTEVAFHGSENSPEDKTTEAPVDSAKNMAEVDGENKPNAEVSFKANEEAGEVKTTEAPVDSAKNMAEVDGENKPNAEVSFKANEEAGEVKTTEAPVDSAKNMVEVEGENKPNAEVSFKANEEAGEVKTTEAPVDSAKNMAEVEGEKKTADISFRAENDKKVETSVKKPEIIPGEEITPDVDIPSVLSNLKSEDYDVQAQQMEEIARVSLDNPQNAVPYIVREVFSNLIEISKKDTSNLAAPSQAQVDARKKLITNFLIIANSKQQNQKDIKLPYQLTEKDFAIANELSPMEMAERNKEYALYTMAILAKVYTDEVEKQTGNVVPFTDLPGSAAIVDALRFSPNAGVKIAAIDALRHIQRKEYSDELNTLYSLAQADPNPQVAMSAAKALQQNTLQK